MTILYLTSQGSKMSINDNVFVVEEKGGLVKSIPSETLESVVVFGRVELTGACIQRLLSKGIPVTYLGSKGQYYGRLISTSHQNVARLRKQLTLTMDSNYSMIMSKRFISAKIRNQKTVLSSYNRSWDGDLYEEIKQLERAKEQVDRACTYQELMGHEGIASRYYFRGLSKLIHPEFKFNGRSRQPPKDAFNSLISFGYTMIMYEFVGVIESMGLSPYAAFMHRDRERHPTLASDMMEEWRSVLVDRVVMSLIQGREIHIESFSKDDVTGAVYIGQEGIKAFLRKLEMKMRTSTNYIEQQIAPMTFRKAIGHQVQSMVRVIEESEPEHYKSLIIR